MVTPGDDDDADDDDFSTTRFINQRYNIKIEKGLEIYTSGEFEFTKLSET